MKQFILVCLAAVSTAVKVDTSRYYATGLILGDIVETYAEKDIDFRLDTDLTNIQFRIVNEKNSCLWADYDQGAETEV